MGGRALNILSVDVEELYHAEYVRASAARWAHLLRPRALEGLNIVLDLLRECKAEATFFFVGEVAEASPGVLEELEGLGHEVGFHGYHHRPLWEMGPEELRDEVRAFRRLSRVRCEGFRAPSFSLDLRTAWALRVLAEEGFTYDSSIFPARTPLYGLPGAPTRPYKPSLSDPRLEDERSPIWEFPATLLELGPLRVPLCGGFYLRLTPADLIVGAVRRLNRHGQPAILYVHVWELDPKAGRVPLQSPWRTFVTYYNLGGVAVKLRHILRRARFTSFRSFMEREGLL